MSVKLLLFSYFRIGVRDTDIISTYSTLLWTANGQLFGASNQTEMAVPANLTQGQIKSIIIYILYVCLGAWLSFLESRY